PRHRLLEHRDRLRRHLCPAGRRRAGDHADATDSDVTPRGRPRPVAPRAGAWQIARMAADATDVTLLNPGTGHPTEPAWSPDGNRIAFVSGRKKNPDIWVVNLNGTGLQQLTIDTNIDGSPTWSPSVTNPQIMWSNGPGGQLDIWKMQPNGNGKTRVTTTEDVNTGDAGGSEDTGVFRRR